MSKSMLTVTTTCSVNSMSPLYENVNSTGENLQWTRSQLWSVADSNHTLYIDV